MNTLFKIIKITTLVVFGLFVILLIVGWNAAQESNRSTSNTTAEVVQGPVVFNTTVKELETAYKENTVAADLKYKNKRFKISGTVKDINTDIFSNAYITMKGENMFMGPQFELEDKNQAISLKQGQRITMICTGYGDVAKTPMNKKCEIQ
jgi:hypothetical protein